MELTCGQRSFDFVVRESWVALPSAPELAPGFEELGAEPALSPERILSASLAGDELLFGKLEPLCAAADPTSASISVAVAKIAGYFMQLSLCSFVNNPSVDRLALRNFEILSYMNFIIYRLFEFILIDSQRVDERHLLSGPHLVRSAPATPIHALSAHEHPGVVPFFQAYAEDYQQCIRRTADRMSNDGGASR